MSSKAVSELRVKDVMTRNPISISMSASVQELAETFEANDISGVPVVDAQDRVVGVVSKTDLIHRCVEGPVGSGPQSFFAALAEGIGRDSEMDPEALGTVGDFMTEEPVTAELEEPLAAVAHRMAAEGVHRVVVVDDTQTAIGMVTTLDLLKNFPE